MEDRDEIRETLQRLGKSAYRREREGDFYGTEKDRPLGLRERDQINHYDHNLLDIKQCGQSNLV